jgi:hypothetical protein
MSSHFKPFEINMAMAMPLSARLLPGHRVPGQANAEKNFPSLPGAIQSGESRGKDFWQVFCYGDGVINRM